MKRKNIPVSVIATFRNEEAAIKPFIDSLLAQSKKPDEIVLVDANSTDKTIDLIQEYIDKGEPIKLIIKGGNRSVGRNTAIEAASNEYIAATDVGCEVANDWLEKITQPFTDGAELVAGYFEPKPYTWFESLSSQLMTDRQTEIDVATWLPSSRSIAFTKHAWHAAGKYPEYKEFGNDETARMCGGEDTLFDLSLKRAGFTFADGLAAVVYWRPRPTLVEFYKQYRMYSIGDGIRLVDYPVFKSLTVKYTLLVVAFVGLLFVYPLLSLAALLIFLVYKARSVLPKWRASHSGVRGLLLMTVLVITYDIARIVGFWKGASVRKTIPEEKRITWSNHETH